MQAARTWKIFVILLLTGVVSPLSTAQPRFLRDMKSKKVVVGSTAVFECIFTGNPKPKVEWFKNSTRIAKGKHGRFNVNDQLLIILGVRFDDAGTYSCRVSNALGMKQQIAKLAVVSGI